MYNFLIIVSKILAETPYEFNNNGDQVLNPIYNAISLVGPYAITIVGCLSMVYGIFLGVKYAHAEDEATKANAQKTLINFIIGAVTVWILIMVLYAIRRPLGEWIMSD